jgi:phage shock protein A
MGTIARWTSRITASFDWLLDQVENHEALVTSAIKEMQEAASKAHVQLRRVQKDGERLRERHAVALEKTNLWRERALRVHDSDRSKALECMRRRKAAEREVDYLQKQLKEHDRVLLQLKADLGLIGDRIEELKRRKNAFSARQTRTEAIEVIQREELSAVREIDEVFDRWEIKLGVCDLANIAADSLEEEFEEGERLEELEVALDALVRENTAA